MHDLSALAIHRTVQINSRPTEIITYFWKQFGELRGWRVWLVRIYAREFRLGLRLGFVRFLFCVGPIPKIVIRRMVLPITHFGVFRYLHDAPAYITHVVIRRTVLRITSSIYYAPYPLGGGIKWWCCLSVCLTSVCLSRTPGLSREQRGLGWLKLAQR